MRVQNVGLPPFLLPWVSFKCVPKFLHLLLVITALVKLSL